MSNLKSIMKTVFLRDWTRFRIERSRWFGAVGQPLLFWLMLGFGFGNSFRAPGGQGYGEYFFPGALAMVVLFTTMFASMSIIDDRNNGFLQSVLVLPNSRLGVLVGKVGSIVSLTVVQAMLYVVAAPLAGISFSQISFLHLFICLILGTSGLCLFSLAGAWLINSVAGYHGIMAVILFPMWLLSGALFPLDEGWRVWASWVNPLAYFVTGLRACFDAQKISFGFLCYPYAGMLLLLLISYVFAFRIMKRTGVSVV